MGVLSVFATTLSVASTALAYVDYPTIPQDRTTPVQQRLAYHAPGAVSVGWNTYEQLAKPCVQYGTSSSSLTSETCSNSSITYNTARTWSNYVTLTGLKTGTQYYYKIVSGNSTAQAFKTALPAGDMTPFNASIVVDLGVYGENGYTTKKRDTIPSIQPALEHTTIGALARSIDEYDFVIHPGDFAYADDWYYNDTNLLSEPNVYEAIIENFYDQLAPVAGAKPYMAAPGNHEAVCIEEPIIDHLCPDGQKNFTDFFNRFGRIAPVPFPSASKNKTAVALAEKAATLALPPMWYSYEYGMAHIVMFNTETDFPDAPDTHGDYDLDVGPFGSKKQQLDFLAADLASVDRSVTPWVIAAGHRPWYSTGGSGNQCFACQNAFESILYEYGVDLALFGHVHNSQLFTSLYDNKTDPAGFDNPAYPVYVVAGGAGNIEGLSPVSTNLTGNIFAYADSQSFARLSFLSKTELGVQYYRSNDSELLYSAELYKEHNVDFVRNSV